MHPETMTRKAYMFLRSIKNEAYLAMYMDENDKKAQFHLKPVSLCTEPVTAP